MSVKELIQIPKQKLESFSKTSRDDIKDAVYVTTQTDDTSNIFNVNQSSELDDDKQFVKHPIRDGVPGNVDTEYKRKRKTVKWKPY